MTLVFTPVFSLSICWLASVKWPKVTELYGSAMAGSGFAAMVFCLYAGIVDVESQQFGSMLVLSILY